MAKGIEDLYIPQLATLTNNPVPLIHDDNWVVQQKLDGHRVIVDTGMKPRAFNRSGEERDLPPKLLSAFKTPGRYVLDGELVGKTYHIFDVLTSGESLTNDLRSFRFDNRRVWAENVAGFFGTQYVKPVLTAETTEEKVKLIRACFEEKAEGVIFKHVDKSYRPGRNENFLKYKFTHTVDCFILDANINGKDNFVLGVYRDGEVFECGKVSALTGDGPRAKVGDVVEVTVLYSTKDGKLYQPVKPKLRYDKRPEECTFDQIEACKTNPGVIVNV